LGDIKLLPIYERIQRPKSGILIFLQTLIVPWVFRNELHQTDLLKTNQIWGGWVAVITKWLYDKPLLVRGGYEPNIIHRIVYGKKVIRKYIIWLMSVITYRYADHIWLNTKEIAYFVKKKFGAKAKIISIYPNWIDTSKFYSSSMTNRQKGRILFVGRFAKEKNISLLFKALSGTEVVLDMVGDGELKDILYEEKERLGLTVNFLGNIPNDQMPIIYNSYSVYVICSESEGNPKSLLEAMCCGCAVIGTDTPGIREIIKNEYTGLLVKPDKNQIREAVLNLISDSNLCKDLAKGARQQIIKQNSLLNYLSKEISIYNNLLQR